MLIPISRQKLDLPGGVGHTQGGQDIGQQNAGAFIGNDIAFRGVAVAAGGHFQVLQLIQGVCFGTARHSVAADGEDNRPGGEIPLHGLLVAARAHDNAVDIFRPQGVVLLHN